MAQPNDEPRLRGRVAIVTGAASGIGLATATTLAAEGSKVVIADLALDRAREAAQTICDSGNEALAIHVDVSSEASVEALVASTVATFGRLDVLHNNAAITDPANQALDGAVADADPAVWERTLAVDAYGVLFGCKHAVPPMRAGGGGSIINTSSNSALGGDVARSAYAVAKSAVNSLTRSVAVQVGQFGIRCNAVSPGSIASPSFAANIPPALAATMERNSLLGCLGEPQDVANMVLFLASDASSFVTGQILRVDGGTMSHVPYLGGLPEGTSPAVSAVLGGATLP